MNIFKKIGRVISSAANVMSCAQGVCFKPGEEQKKTTENPELFGMKTEESDRKSQELRTFPANRD